MFTNSVERQVLLEIQALLVSSWNPVLHLKHLYPFEVKSQMQLLQFAGQVPD